MTTLEAIAARLFAWSAEEHRSIEERAILTAAAQQIQLRQFDLDKAAAAARELAIEPQS